MFDLQKMNWKNGPELPLALAAAPTVAFGDSFLMLGGYKYKSAESDSVYSREVQYGPKTRFSWSNIFPFLADL